MSTMRKTKGSGVMPAVMTFWNADESFNQKETERYIQWVLDCGAHSLSVTGSTGENISMSDDEQKKDHRVPREVRRPSGPRLSRHRQVWHRADHRDDEVRTEVRRRGRAGHHAVLPHPAQESCRKPLQEAPRGCRR